MKKTREKMREEGLSILVSAYKAESYIKEMFDSIMKQKYMPENWEVLVGIDNCKSTLEEIIGIIDDYPDNFKIYFMKENRGWAVTRNTLFFRESKYDKIMSFDADDMMMEDHVKIMLANYEPHSLVRAMFRTYVTNTSYVPYGDYGTAGNHILIGAEDVDYMGGWIDWPISADSEFLIRAQKNDLQEIKVKVPSFLLRIHKDSLTNAKETRNGSEMRNMYKKQLDVLKFIPQKRINPVFSLYEQLY